MKFKKISNPKVIFEVSKISDKTVYCHEVGFLSAREYPLDLFFERFELINPERINHKIFGEGIILEDKEGLCKKGEVYAKFFKPTGRLYQPDSSRALSVDEYKDIVKIADLLNND